MEHLAALLPRIYHKNNPKKRIAGNIAKNTGQIDDAIVYVNRYWLASMFHQYSLASLDGLNQKSDFLQILSWN